MPDSANPNKLVANTPLFLVVDDELDLCLLIKTALERSGYSVDTAHSVPQAKDALALAAQRGKPYTAVMTDLRLSDDPNDTGLVLTEYAHKHYPGMPISIMTAYGSTQNAVDALKCGAFDYLTKPVSIAQLRDLAAHMCALSRVTLMPPLLSVATTPASSAALNTAVPQSSVARSNSILLPEQPATQASSPVQRLISGNSPAMRALQAQIAQLARTQSPVVLEGESGTGKELAARALHNLGARADKPFIAINCGAIPETLIEAELFGVKKGAFTGANTDRAGVFQAAHQGTLLLDEIGDLPLNMQVKLLRVLQEKTVRRVGSANEEPIDVRVVAASHQSLAHLVAKGQFRQDLFYRLNVMHVTLPPLRERGEDCVALAQAYLLRAQATDTPTLAADAQDWLRAYAFPGNVRELENLMERALALCQAEETSLVRADMLAPSAEQVSTIRESTTRENTTQSRLPTTVPASSELGAASTGDAALPDNNLKLPMDLGAHLASIEKRIIESTLMTLRYNRTATAEALGLNARQLRYRIEQLGIA